MKLDYERPATRRNHRKRFRWTPANIATLAIIILTAAFEVWVLWKSVTDANFS